MLNITAKDIDNLQFIQGPVGYYYEDELREEEQGNGDVIECPAVLLDRKKETVFLIKMFISTGGEFKDKITIREFDVMDMLMPMVGDYEKAVISFVQGFAEVDKDPKLYEVFKTKAYQKIFLEGFNEHMKPGLKEIFDYDLVDDPEIVFY